MLSVLLLLLTCAHTGFSGLLAGHVLLSNSQYMNVTVEINTDAKDVNITLTGRVDCYLAVGFDGTQMENTYAIVAFDSKIEEYYLGHHKGGSLLSPTTKMVHEGPLFPGNTDGLSYRTVLINRPLEGETSNHFTFPSKEADIRIIWARGESNEWGDHDRDGHDDTLQLRGKNIKHFFLWHLPFFGSPFFFIVQSELRINP